MSCRLPILLLSLATLALLATLMAGCAPNPIRAVDARRAASSPDPVAGKLVTYLRLLSANDLGASEIDAFETANPEWPNHAWLEHRRQQALAGEADQAVAVAQCDRAPLRVTGALLRCADVYTAAGRPEDAAATVRRAWIGGIVDPADEADFLRRWGAVVTPADQWTRFQTLVWRHQAAAERQVPRIEPSRRALAQARLALRRDDLTAEAKLAALPADQSTDPGLVLDRAAWLRRRERFSEARDLWLSLGAAARRDAPTAHRAAFWTERERLARRLLRADDDQGAYAITAMPGPMAPEQTLEAEFLAGFIALRRLHDPALATKHFQALAAISGAAITQGRAFYWLGRARAEAGDDPTAEYAQAARWPTTFYGQLAALAIDQDQARLAAKVRAARDPAWTQDQALDFSGTELVRAAVLLAAWGDGRHARGFLQRSAEQDASPADRALAAHLANGLGLSDAAVTIARRMGRDGLMLPQAGWPTPVTPTDATLDPAAVLALIRQESSFDPQAVSPSGARGLMQLMPATAQYVARHLATDTSLASLTDDPAHNLRLGSTYLREVLDQFGGSWPLAFAAYNAGPRRVREWLAANGDPRDGGVDMVDWIELIPVEQTRNYVQRVLENATIYQAQRSEAGKLLLANWSR